MAKPRAVPDETLTKAVNALLKWLRSSKKPNQDPSIFLILTLTRVPHRGRSLSLPLPLPHPLHGPTTLVFSDGPRSPSLSSLESAVQALDLPIPNLIPISSASLQELRPPRGGILFVDRRVAKRIPKKTGEVVEVDLAAGSWAEEVKKRVRTTEVRFRGGTCVGIRVGRAGMAGEEIAENVRAAVEGAVGKVPKKWANVRGLHLKAAESVALPIYEREGGGGRNGGEGRAAKRRKIGA